MDDSYDPRVPDTRSHWEVWYQDTFDRETCPSRDREGTDIRAGLAFLWQRVLDEGVTDDGRLTFSRFYIVWGDETLSARAAVVTGPSADPALAKLRKWRSDTLYSALGHAHATLLRQPGRVERADPTHESAQILESARDAEDSSAFQRRLTDALRAAESPAKPTE